MSVRTDVINLLVNVNGDKSRDELNQLHKKAAELNSEMKGLKKNTQEYKDKALELKQVTSQMDSLKKSIGLASLTQKELVNELKKLQAMKGNMIPQTKEFDELQKKIDAVNNRLYEVRNGVYGFGAVLHKLKDEIRQFGVLAVGYLGFEFVTEQFKSMISGAGKLSDQLADLRRVTGMTDEEVQNLNSSLKEMDTRTSNSSLREIAITAGKLGVAKDDIASFTQEVDKLVVSLGDELGNADEITSSLGKILNVFDGKVNGDNISKLGNAMIQLANAGVATGSFISDFTQRISGIAKASDMSLGSTVGLAAGFEELGLRSESSSTALQKLLSTIAGDIPAAAKIAGMDLKEFNLLFAKTPQEALIKYAEGLVKNKASFSEITKSFKDAGEEGARVVQTLQAIGQRGDFLREKITLGNEAMTNTSAITEAFALKNENLGATIDKLGKQFNAFMTSSSITNFLQNAIEGLANFIKFLSNLPQILADNAKALLAFGAAFIAMNLGAFANMMLLLIGRFGLYIISANAATLATTLLTIATKALQMAVSLMVASAAFLIVKVVQLENEERKYAKALTDSATKMRVTSEVRLRQLELIRDEVAQVNLAIAKLRSYNTTQTEKERILKSLKETSNGYLNSLTLENIATEKGVNLLNAYVKSLSKKVEAQAREAIWLEKEKRKQELMAKYGLEGDSTNEIDNKKQELNRGKSDRNIVGTIWDFVDGTESARRSAINDLNEIIKLKKEGEALALKIATTPTTTTGGSTGGAGLPGSTISAEETKKAKQNIKARENLAKQAENERKRAYAKFLDDLEKLNEEHRLAELSGIDAEIQKVHDKYKGLYETAKKYGFDKIELTKLETEEINRIHENANKEILEKVKEFHDDEIMLNYESMREKEQAVQTFRDKMEAFDEAEAEEKLKRNEAVWEKEQELEKQKQEAKGHFMADYFDAQYQLAVAYDSFATLVENQQLLREQKNNDKRKENHEKLLKSKRISQAQYDADIKRMDAEADKRKRDIDIKQLERKKKMSIMTAIMNGAEGITKIWSAYATMPWMAALLSGITLGAVGLQLANINAQEVPQAGIGMKVGGRKHSEGGTLVEAERGEYILSANTVDNNRPIADALLDASMNHGGKSIADNLFAQSQTINAQELVPLMQYGGFINSSGKPYTTNGLRSSSTSDNQNVYQIPQAPLKAYVVFEDLQEKQKIYESAMNEGKLNQQ